MGRRRKFGIEEAWAAFNASRPPAARWTLKQFREFAKKWSDNHYIVPLGMYGRSAKQRPMNSEVWVFYLKGEIKVLLASLEIELKQIEIDEAVYEKLLSETE